MDFSFFEVIFNFFLNFLKMNLDIAFLRAIILFCLIYDFNFFFNVKGFRQFFLVRFCGYINGNNFLFNTIFF